ncbi:cytochrome oxidase assembly protein (plasmid) [Cellulomonas sp. WB94]|uniref:COX15/CtaA family protein n=1 Tax=Cellulomonas sp. WB94 TaxID=2173174 RepID=UPI000D576B6B|nr:COX15/CtaA family protein [Cellulomonas sp. WB94]PVU81272.1 cytochrome oxidase assembly protein [Cellulomonas sp. WB94]
MSTTSVTEPPTDRLARRRRWTRRALITNVVAQGVLVVTGGAVRLTGSGLGCSTWPACEPGSFTPALHEATSIHPFIEFGNRTLTGFLAAIALTVAVLVWTDRSRSRSYRLLGLAPVLGVVAQAVIGGVTVLFHLNPAVVGIHMLVSLALVAVSTVLVVRERAGDGPARPVVAPRQLSLARLLTVVAVVLLALGVVVTGSGPHGGDDDVAYRFAVDPVLIARAHAGAVWLFVVVLAVVLIGLYRTAAPGTTRRAALWLLAVTLLQGVIGYVQYFTGLPVVLVGLHMLGAVLLTASLTWFVLSLRTRDLVVPTTATD